MVKLCIYFLVHMHKRMIIFFSLGSSSNINWEFSQLPASRSSWKKYNSTSWYPTLGAVFVISKCKLHCFLVPGLFLFSCFLSSTHFRIEQRVACFKITVTQEEPSNTQTWKGIVYYRCTFSPLSSSTDFTRKYFQWIEYFSWNIRFTESRGRLHVAPMCISCRSRYMRVHKFEAVWFRGLEVLAGSEP